MQNIHYQSLSRRLQKYVEFTARAAYDNPGIAGAKIACLLLQKNKPISLGFNSVKTHTLQAQYGKNYQAIHMHAEIDTIRRALNHLSADEISGCTMIIIRCKKNREWGMAKPCTGGVHGSGCQAAIESFGIGKVYYSTDDTGYLGIL